MVLMYGEVFFFIDCRSFLGTLPIVLMSVSLYGFQSRLALVLLLLRRIIVFKQGILSSYLEESIDLGFLDAVSEVMCTFPFRLSVIWNSWVFCRFDFAR